MPKVIEQRLKASAAARGLSGQAADAYVYGTMNNLGYMRGNQETAVVRRAAATPRHPHKNLGNYLHKAKGSR